MAGEIGRPPVTPVLVYPTGVYDAVRTSKAQGSCGIHGYPCRHPGADLVAKRGTPVVAPHDGWVMVSKSTDKAPFQGYGPAVVLLAHDDATDSWWTDLVRSVTPGAATRKSLRYSLLAHLDPSTLTYDVDVRAGDMNARRYEMLDDGTDVPTWVLLDAPPTYVRAGEVLGYIGTAGHVHWEVRKQPFGLHADGATMDPFLWLSHYDDGTTAWGTTTLPVDASKAKRPPSGGSAWLVVMALAAAYALTRGKR